MFIKTFESKLSSKNIGDEFDLLFNLKYSFENRSQGTYFKMQYKLARVSEQKVAARKWC